MVEYVHQGPTGQQGDLVPDTTRDIERFYSTAEVVAKLRRLADALESETPFRIQIAGERIRVPARAEFSIEHERGEDEEEIEFQLKWQLDPVADDKAADDNAADEAPVV
jgi:amphi-Trp domain-containing protein